MVLCDHTTGSFSAHLTGSGLWSHLPFSDGKTKNVCEEFAMKAYAIDTVVLNYVSDRVNRILVDLSNSQST